MAGYVRQSTADIIPTATVRAAPINAEYNALRDAFAASGGHKHDGTTGEGEYVPLIADLDALNKVVIDTTNNRVGVFVEVSSAAVEQIRIQDGAVVPVTDNDIDLGTSLLEFKDLYLDGTAYIDTLAVHQSATITSNLTVNGNTTLGNAASDTVTLTGDVASNIIPSADSTYDLGAVGSEWQNLYIDGTANIDSLVADTADINAGTIDNTVIGGTTAAAADFTTMDASGNVTVGGTLGVTGATTMSSTLAVTGNSTVGGTLGVTGLSTLATVDINGGNIDATAIGSNTASSAVFTNLTASGTVNFAGATVSNLGAVTTAAIGGGTINNSVIGGSTPAAITGTTITSNSGFTGNLSGNVTGDVTGNLTGNVTSTGNSTLNNLTVNGTLDVTNTTIENVSDPTTAQQAATKAYVDGEITSLIGGAPGALDTLNELAAAINDDQNVYTTLTTSIATKLPKAGGTMSGEIAMGDNKITGLATPTSNADAATKLYVDNQTTQAETYAANALASQNAAAASYDAFDDRYLGAKSSDPTLDNDSNALITGALYFDSTNGVMKVYNGSEWANASSSVEGVKANFYYTATNAQTVFSGSDDNSNTLVIDQVGLVNVYMNGVRLHESDYTISAGGNSVTLATGAATGDLIYLEVFGNFTGQSGAEVAITGGSITGLSALGVSGNATFGDNNKAIFGTGSDLQIYHDGSDSYVKDAGTGYLNLLGTGRVVVGHPSNGHVYLNANYGGDVELFFNNSKKLETTSTGVDITGTLVSDGLTMDTSANSSYAIELGADRTSAGQALGIIKGSWNNTVVAQINLAAGDDTTNKDNGRIFLRTASAGSTANRLQVAENGNISFYEDQGTTAKLTWDASAESLNFADNGKAIFGAGSDLQIYHDGLVSYIDEVGTGDLTIKAGPALRLRSDYVNIANAANNQDLASFTSSGAANLYYSGSKKLATTATGIDVTGTLVSDGLTVDGVSTLNNHVKIANGYSLGWDDITTRITGNSSTDLMQHYTAGVQRMRIASNGDINFYATNGTTQAFHWDSADESLGIGTTSPSAPLQVAYAPSDTVGAVGISLKDKDNAIEFGLRLDATSKDLHLDRYYSGGWLNTMSFDRSTGNVGIGTSSVDSVLHLQKSDATAYSATATDGQVGVGPTIYLENPANANTTVGGQIVFGMRSTEVQARIAATGGTAPAITFGTNDAERMRIDSSGNLLVGQTVGNVYNQSSVTGLKLDGANGNIQTARDSNVSLLLNRYGTDGDIASFYKDGAPVGSIGNDSTNLYMVFSTAANNDVGVSSGDLGTNEPTIFPTNGGGSVSNGNVSLGYNNGRWKDLYLSGGVYLGGTGAANLLDDYEEGDYDVAITCGTSGTITLSTSYNRASYVKVGNLVHVQGLLIISAVSSPTGFFEISLPFTVANLTDRAGDSSGSILVHGSSANVRDFVCMINEGLNKLLVYLGDATTRQEDSANAITANVQINFQCSYRTT